MGDVCVLRVGCTEQHKAGFDRITRTDREVEKKNNNKEEKNKHISVALRNVL